MKLLLLIMSLATAAQATRPDRAPEVTPTSMPGADTFVYRDLQPEPVRIHVFKPTGWKASDRRAALIFFFGGGFTHGTPAGAGASFAKWAAKQGMVGIAPDYRVASRYQKTTPPDCVADARLALRWVQDHADELGIDPLRIVVGGSSAGGSLTLWTAIGKSPPGSSEDEAPREPPAALILLSAPSDIVTDPRGKRFGDHPELYSPLQQLEARMPPILMFHGDADPTVAYSQSVALHQKLVDTGNVVEFVTVPGGNHNFMSQLPEWKTKGQTMVEEFLTKHGVLPAEKSK